MKWLSIPIGVLPASKVKYMTSASEVDMCMNSLLGLKAPNLIQYHFYAHNNMQNWGHRENGVLESFG